MTTDQLQHSSAHVYYELKQLIRAGQRLLNKQYPDDVTRVFILEAWVLHLRCLLEFFWLGNRAGYVHASDYVGDWTSRRPPKPDDLFKRTNVLGAHISIERKTVLEEEPNWNYVHTTQQIVSVMEVFEAAAPPQLLEMPTWRRSLKAGLISLELL